MRGVAANLQNVDMKGSLYHLSSNIWKQIQRYNEAETTATIQHRPGIDK